MLQYPLMHLVAGVTVSIRVAAAASPRVDACTYVPSSATGKSECLTLPIVLGLLLFCVNNRGGSERRHLLGLGKITAHPLSR